MSQHLRKERTELEAAGSKLLELAVKAGADSAEVCGSFGQSQRIALEKQEYHLASADGGYSLGLRVLKGARQGFASCNSTDPADLKEIALRATEIAGFSPQNPLFQILPSGNVPPAAPQELWDDALFQLSLATQREWTGAMVDELLKDARFRLNEGTVSVGSSLFLLINSLGTHKLSRETQITWSAMGMAVEGDNITSFDYFSALSRQAAGVPEKLARSGREFRDRLLAGLQQGPGKNYRGTVLFSPRAVLDVLVSGLEYHFNGRNVLEGTTRWKTGDRGTAALNSQLTLQDNPWLPDTFGCSPFDREGVPTGPLTLVEAGTLRNFIVDSYAAKGLGLAPTGHAAGGPSAAPSLSHHCLVVAGGTEPLTGMLRTLPLHEGGFLLVQRYSGSTDPVTGDFSGVAKGAEWWTPDGKSHGVRETLISGNLFTSLGEGFLAASRETHSVDAAASAPYLAIDGISVTSPK